MYQGKTVIGIIVAAGIGSRMGLNLPKQFLKIGSKTMVEETSEKFEKNRYVDGFFVVSSEEYLDYVKELLGKSTKLIDVVAGGATRQDSVSNAVKMLEEECIVLIHDCARPYVDDGTIERVISATFDFGAAIPVIDLTDTVKSTFSLDEKNTFIRTTLDRDALKLAQTPQGFKSEIIKKAYENAEYLEIIATDDASLVEIMGEKVAIVVGNQKNIKITRKEDMPTENRIGNGFDVHELICGRDLIIGGEKILYEKGLDGHSDADVLVHAVIDALLGAASLGDIGVHFPDNDEKYKGVDSIELLKKVAEKLDEKGFEVVNIDSTVMCEAPKLVPYIDAMRQNIAEALLMEVDRINIKATTTEKLGFIGRGDGIAASSVCLLKIKHC